MSEKRVYTFGNGKAEGNAKMREELGGKGANLAEMNLIGVPVPPGFTITTSCCNEYYEVGQEKIKEILQNEVMAAVAHTENLMNSKFGDTKNPLLVSVRSGARAVSYTHLDVYKRQIRRSAQHNLFAACYLGRSGEHQYRREQWSRTTRDV